MGVRGDLRLLETAVRRRWLIDTEKTARVVNESLDSEDERIKLRAATIAVVMEGQNQKDEQHADDMRMDAGRNRILALLGGSGPEESPIVIEHRAEKVSRVSNRKPSPKQPGGKNKRRNAR